MNKIIFLLSLLGGYMYAQDVHFSQFNASPINLNPALTGVFDGDYRFVGNFRNQWMAIPVPYNTFSMSADMKLPYHIGNDLLGAGMIINKDKAGDSNFGTNQAYWSLAYLKKLTPSSTQFLSFGLQAGVSGKNFNATNLTFDNQYDGTAYNPNIASTENYSTTKINYFDASIGVNWLYKPAQRTSLNIGSSLFHLSAPKQSYLGDHNIQLDRKFIQHATLQLNLNHSTDLMASVLFTKQGRFTEFVGGSTLKYFLQSNVSLGTAVYLGAYFRTKDAIIITSGMDYNNFTFGISYDVNISQFTPASNLRGGFEFSLIYIIRKFNPLKSSRTMCPVFL